MAKNQKFKSQADHTIKRADGTVLKCGGMKMCASRKDTPKFKSSKTDLPRMVDLREMMTPIENQGAVNSCSANAVAGAYEYLVKVSQGFDYDVSRLFLYYNGRRMWDPDMPVEDEGSAINLVVESLDRFGACSEDAWPYDEDTDYVNSKPSKDAYKEAKQFKIQKYESIPLDLTAWRQCLAQGYPIVFGCALFESFDRQRIPGVIPMPSSRDQGRGSHGLHAMLCVGYSDADQMFIIRNSWGEQWGDNGYCYMPYDYILDPDLNCSGESYVIYSADPVDESKISHTWNNDCDGSVIPEFETAFADLDDETWQTICDECGDYDIIHRIGGLYVAGAIMDDEFADEEIEVAAQKLKKLLKFFGVKMNPKKVLHNCLELCTVEDFIESTLIIFAKYLPDSLKLTILNDMIEIAGADGLDEEEATLINDIVEVFEIDEDTEAMEFDDDYCDDYDWEDDDEEDDDDDNDGWDDDDDDDDDDDWGDDDDDDDDDWGDDDDDDDDDWDDDDDDDDWDDDDDDNNRRFRRR